MGIVDFLKNEIEKNNQIERQIIQSMQNHDFYKAHYLDKCQTKHTCEILNLITNSQGIDEKFSKILKDR